MTKRLQTIQHSKKQRALHSLSVTASLLLFAMPSAHAQLAGEETTASVPTSGADAPTQVQALTDTPVLPSASNAPTLDARVEAPVEPVAVEDEATEEVGGDFVPAFDDEESADFGGDFAPAFDDEESAEVGGDFAPTFDDEESADFGGDFAPAFDDEEETTTVVAEEEDDEYYMRMWESLDATETAEVVEAPPAEIVAGAGRIEGTLFDKSFNQPLQDASVTIEELEKTIVTGPEGVFYFDLEPGVYTVRIRALGYAPQAFQIEVFSEEVAAMGRIDVEEDTASAMTLEIEGRMDRQGAAAQLVQRQQAATTRDAISAEQISRTGDSSASDAARRVVGVTMLEDRYAVIRGLQGRYNNVLLNGVPVMVLNPAYPAAELDLFPASLLASMAVTKVPTATLPADFAGGLLEIETGDFSEDFELKVSAGLSFDTQTFLQDFQRYNGSGTDFLGFDNGRRRLPDSMSQTLRPRSVTNPNGPTRDEINAAARDLDNVWNPTSRTGLFGTSFGVGVSDTIEFGGERALSYRLNLTYKNSPKTRHDIVGGIEGFDRAPYLQDSDSYTTEVVWGALGALRYDFDANNELSLVIASTTLSEDSVSLLEGTNSESIYDSRRELYFSSQRAVNLQLLGQHRDLFNVSDLSWAAALSQGRSYQPDARYASMIGDPNSGDLPTLSQQPGSSERYFQDMSQLELTGRFDWKFNLGDGFYRRQIAVGGLARSASRDYDARRFRYLRAPGIESSVYTGDLEVLLAPENIGTLFNFNEATDMEGRDSYELNQLQLSTYLVTDLELTDWMRVVAGARLESFDQELLTAQERYSGQRHDIDILPSASLIFSFKENMAIRAAYGASVARPQGHEFASTILQDYQRRRQLQGNPDLERTLVQNVDLRWEMFPSPTEVLSATLFYKNFSNHIENVIVSRNGSLQAQNIDDAQSYGVEVEAQLDLARLTDAFKGLSLATNFAWTHSRVRLSSAEENIFTSAERPMADQSPFVMNALLGWDHEQSGWQVNVVYSMIGRTLVDVGAVQVPDVYREAVHTLDVNASWDIDDHWSLNLSVDDIVPMDVRYAYGDFTRDRSQRATSFGIGFGWKY